MSQQPPTGGTAPVTVAHLTTVASSLRYLLLPQLLAVRERGGRVLGISAPGPDAEMLAERGIEHRNLPGSTRRMNPLADLRAAWSLWRLLRREKIDVLHTHNPKPGLYGRVVGRLARVPVVVNTCHGLYATNDTFILKRMIVLALEGFAARFSDAELIQNPEDEQLLTRWRANHRDRTTLLGNGVDLSRFGPNPLDPDERQLVRERWGANDGTVVVGMVGRLVREKGFRELFDAARLISEHHSLDRYVIVVVGPPDPEKADAITEEEIRAAEDAGVVFLGHREDIDQLYGAMDLFVLPSYREGFPRAAMEAAATGLPVIASDVRGCRQVVDHDVTGLLVPVRDPMALADAIVKLGEDPERRELMAKSALVKAERQFDERRVVQHVLDTYERVARAKGLDDLADAFSPS